MGSSWANTEGQTVTALSDYLNEVARQHDIIGVRPFADAAGISKTSASRYLDGTRTPSREILQIMADHLNRRYANAVKYERMLELAQMEPDPIPFEVPKEFDRLTKQQRRALLRVGWLFLDVSNADVSQEDEEDEPSLNWGNDTPSSRTGAYHSSRGVTESVFRGGE
jgi:hypothetical protein